MIIRSPNTSEKMMFSAVSLCTLVLGACMTSVGGTTAIQPGYGLRHPHLSPLNETANAPSHDEDASGNLWEMKPSSSPLPDARSGSGGAMLPCEGFMVFGGCSSSCCYCKFRRIIGKDVKAKGIYCSISFCSSFE